jgi:hypothetical protein
MFSEGTTVQIYRRLHMFKSLATAAVLSLVASSAFAADAPRTGPREVAAPKTEVTRAKGNEIVRAKGNEGSGAQGKNDGRTAAAARGR